MIYALVVAIDKYPIKHHELNGCVNDAEAFIAYLEGNYDCDELDIKHLFDKEATRSNIIDGFKHFQQANSDDTCLLYYCGHGAQATAPTEFRHIDPDGLLETLVCWDSRIEGGRDLFDKELSYLIWEATNTHHPHFAAIFDCCHSGTNTRDIRVTSRMADPMKNIPQARDFHGLANYQRSTTGAGREQYAPPSGRHVALAAARAEQTAKELRIGHQTHGAFTYNLIAILEQFQGNISYGQLLTHLQGRVPNYVSEQNPQLGTVDSADEDLLFLGKAADDVPKNYTAHYDKKAGEWHINLGEIHNLHNDQADKISVAVKVGTKAYELGVSKVDIRHSVLADVPTELDESISYQAEIKSLPVRILKVGLDPDMGTEMAETILQTEQDAKAAYFKIVPHDQHPEYWIKLLGKDLILTRPGDDHPVFRRLPSDDYDMRRLFMADVDAVGQYHHVLDTSNPRTTIRKEDYDIELYRVKDNTTWEANDMAPADKVDWQNDEVAFNYDYDSSKEGSARWVQPAFRCKVRNTGRRPLYFSALSLQADYSISNKFMRSQKLAPGEEAWLLDVIDSGDTFRTIPLTLADAFQAHGVTEITEHFKFIISTLEINTSDLNQKGLEMDDPSKAEIKRVGRDSSNYPPKHSWTAVDITYKVVRPLQEAQVDAGESRSLGTMLDIQMPAGVSALATLNGQKAATRALASDGLKLPEHPKGWARHALSAGIGEHETIDTLELANTTGADQVSADNPIRVKLHQELEEGEVILPLGFDPETGMYYPLGIMDKDGSMRIEELPAPNTTSTRSLGGSIKIFFTKAIGKYLPFVYQHPQLAIGALEAVDTTAEELAAAGLKVIYDTDASKIKDAVANAQHIALYIHGIIGDTTEMPKTMELVEDATGRKLKDQYDLVLTFDYENLDTSIQDTAALLRDKLASVGLSPDHGKTFHIIAHSMGGLVSRWFVEQLEGNKVVSQLIMLGTPNQGSPYGSLYEMATPLLATAVNGAAFLQPYILPIKYVGKFVDKMFSTLKQMNPDSAFYEALNVGTDPGIPYIIIAGNTQLIPFEVQDKQAKLLRKIMERFKNRGHYDALDLMLFKSPNDIAVKTEFIKGIPGSESWARPPQVMECACDHISYFGDPAGLERIQEVLLGS